MPLTDSQRALLTEEELGELDLHLRSINELESYSYMSMPEEDRAMHDHYVNESERRVRIIESLAAEREKSARLEREKAEVESWKGGYPAECPITGDRIAQVFKHQGEVLAGYGSAVTYHTIPHV
jgi:hypothetical protein